MDEVVFRSSQKLENVQIQLSLIASKSKYFFYQYSEQARELLIHLWNNSQSVRVKENLKTICQLILKCAQEIQFRVSLYANEPKRIFLNFLKILGRKWTKRDVCFGLAGFICGGLIGFAIGLAVRQKHSIIRYMQAVQCVSYLGTQSAVVVEDAISPYRCGEFDVLINTKAGSINQMDVEICYGYGRSLRKILRKLYQNSSLDLPIILGRSFSGVVTDVGSGVKKIEVGDEVWGAVPFWSQGTLSQTILLPEYRVSRKPTNIGFEAASSLPYAGTIALSLITQLELTSQNAQGKRILVQDGCSPVGCLLIQLFSKWGSHVTTTCNKRAQPVVEALGCTDVILIEKSENFDFSNKKDLVQHEIKSLLLELDLREKYHMIIFTKNIQVDSLNKFEDYCHSKEKILSTVPSRIYSDNYNFLWSYPLAFFIWIKYQLEKISRISLNEYDEVDMCHTRLEQVGDWVESGTVESVVDRIFYPHDIEIALNHIQSSQSIGNTIITFR